MNNKASKAPAKKYQFVIGVNLPALEDDLNRLAVDEAGFKLNQVFYVQGTGFIGVVECTGGVSNKAVITVEEVDGPKKIVKPSKK